MRPSRQIISGEIVVSLFAISYAWSGGVAWPLDPGPLHRAIALREGHSGNLAWAVMLGAPAALLVLYALREWVSWPVWREEQLRRSAVVRGRLACVQCFSWLYMLHLVIALEQTALAFGGDAWDGVARLPVLTAHSIVGAVACAWSYLENRRVRREITCEAAHRAAAAVGAG